MSRWPSWVYGVGEEPDYRFSLANERTLLAWLRTSLALLAAGVAVDAIDLAMPEVVQRLLAALLVVLGLVCAAASWLRWARAERSIRRSQPLPSSSAALVLAVGVAVAAVVVLVAAL